MADSAGMPFFPDSLYDSQVQIPTLPFSIPVLRLSPIPLSNSALSPRLPSPFLNSRTIWGRFSPNQSVTITAKVTWARRRVIAKRCLRTSSGASPLNNYTFTISSFRPSFMALPVPAVLSPPV